ncbi:MAG TPA: hypothetical protein VFW73_06985, partial [Lacipirellulaceae bacterium]|nr:hypothetical protein [Lacipirellulaceae bacterium]
MTTPIQFISPVEITAANSKGPRRFTTTAYTGGALRVAGYTLPIVVDLAGLSTRKSVTANLDHDAAKRVGHIEDVQNDGAQLVLAGIVSAANQAADEFVKAHDNGYPWQASIEASPERIEEIRKGESANANGQTFQGPLFIARKSVLSAVAFVPNGADDNTHVSIAATRQKVQRMKTASFQEFVSEMLPNTNTADLTDSQLANLHANYCGRPDASDADFAAVAPMIQASADPVAVEEKRLRQIEAACRGTWGDDAEQIQTLKASAIGGELAVDDLISKLRGIRMEQTMNNLGNAPPAIHSSSRDTSGKLIEAALCLNASMPNIEKHFDERTLEQA